MQKTNSAPYYLIGPVILRPFTSSPPLSTVAMATLVAAFGAVRGLARHTLIGGGGGGALG